MTCVSDSRKVPRTRLLMSQTRYARLFAPQPYMQSRSLFLLKWCLEVPNSTHCLQHCICFSLGRARGGQVQSSADRALKLHSLRELQPLPADRHHRNGIGRQVGGRRSEPTAATGAKTVTKKLFSQSAALLAAVGLSPSVRFLMIMKNQKPTDRSALKTSTDSYCNTFLLKVA